MAELSLVAVAVLGFLLMYNGMRLRRENARLRLELQRYRALKALHDALREDDDA